jgi:hypothetical protein
MFERVNTKIFGIVENMAGMTCPHCSGHIDVFGHGGGAARRGHAPAAAGEVPLDPRVREAGDAGHAHGAGAARLAGRRSRSATSPSASSKRSRPHRLPRRRR